jgi:SSS family solute:Na+ symporter
VAAGAAVVVDVVVSVLVSMGTRPKPDSELRGFVYSLTPKKDFHDANEGQLAWYQKPTQLAAVSAVMVIILNIIFW